MQKFIHILKCAISICIIVFGIATLRGKDWAVYPLVVSLLARLAFKILGLDESDKE